MGANEELTNLLNAPNREDFLISMDVDGAYHADLPWQSLREALPPFDSSKKCLPQYCHFAEAGSTGVSPVEHLYALEDANFIGAADAVGQNFVPDAEVNVFSEAPALGMDCYSRVCSVPPPAYQRPVSRPLFSEVDFDATTSTHPSVGQESESTNSSLESSFQLADGTIVQEKSNPGCTIAHQANITPGAHTSVIPPILDFKSLESSFFSPTLQSVKCESRTLPTMMVRPPHTLPQMTPPMLPQLCSSAGTTLYFPPSQRLGSVWDVDTTTRSVLSKSMADLPNGQREEHQSSLHKSHSTPAFSHVSRSSTGCPLFCSGSSLSKRPKKPYIGKLTPEERQFKIMRYRQKRNLRKFDRGVTYQCRKTLADRRPRVRGRFARNNDINATFPKNKPSNAEVGQN